MQREMDAIPSREKTAGLVDVAAIATRLNALDDPGMVIREISRATTNMGLGHRRP